MNIYNFDMYFWYYIKNLKNINVLHSLHCTCINVYNAIIALTLRELWMHQCINASMHWCTLIFAMHFCEHCFMYWEIDEVRLEQSRINNKFEIVTSLLSHSTHEFASHELRKIVNDDIDSLDCNNIKLKIQHHNRKSFSKSFEDVHNFQSILLRKTSFNITLSHRIACHYAILECFLLERFRSLRCSRLNKDEKFKLVDKNYQCWYLQWFIMTFKKICLRTSCLARVNTRRTFDRSRVLKMIIFQLLLTKSIAT